MFVNEHPALLRVFGFDLFQDTFPLQHGREHVAGVGRRIFRCDQASKKLLGVFFCQRLGGGLGQRFVASFPK